MPVWRKAGVVSINQRSKLTSSQGMRLKAGVKNFAMVYLQSLDRWAREDSVRLTAREVEVLISIGLGMKIVDIAKQMRLTEGSIGKFRLRMMDKLGLQSNAQIVAYALKYGFVISESATKGSKPI